MNMYQKEEIVYPKTKQVVIAIDSMKGSVSSIQAGQAIREGILQVEPSAKVVVRPLADGGEGTVEALVEGLGGTLQQVQVTGPLQEPVEAVYGILEQEKTAIIEMAAAAGIMLVPEEKRNPLHTTTYGVGEMILDAIQKGCRKFIVGIGGSATNDGGVGMLQALGFAFLQEDGTEICPGAMGLRALHEIKKDKINPLLSECTFLVACDVTNPLCGTSGCSAVFGPQKGATAEMIAQMDQWLMHYAAVTKAIFPASDCTKPGTGAAGGLGFAFLSYLNATLESGISIVLKETKLEEYIQDADLVVTGEGRLDGQTIMGKAPIGVAKLAKKYNKAVIAFAGCVTPEAELCNTHGIDAYFPILQDIVSREEAMKNENTLVNLKATAVQVFRLLQMEL